LLYEDAFGITSPPRAHGWPLLDVMEGDQTLFTGEDRIDQAWAIVYPLVSRLASHPPEGFPNYAAGSWGPESATELLARDGRHWRPH